MTVYIAFHNSRLWRLWKSRARILLDGGGLHTPYITRRVLNWRCRTACCTGARESQGGRRAITAGGGKFVRKNKSTLSLWSIVATWNPPLHKMNWGWCGVGCELLWSAAKSCRQVKVNTEYLHTIFRWRAYEQTERTYIYALLVSSSVIYFSVSQKRRTENDIGGYTELIID